MMTMTPDMGMLNFRDRTGYITLVASQDIPANRILAFDKQFTARLANDEDRQSTQRIAGSVSEVRKGEKFEAVADGFADIEVKDVGKYPCHFRYIAGVT